MLETRKVCLQRRDQASNEKTFLAKEDFLQNVENTLQEIQDRLLERATTFRDTNTQDCLDLETFEKHWSDESPGWLVTPWAGSREEEENLSKKHKIAIRCLPLDQQDGENSPCILTGTTTKTRAIWGRSY